MIDCMTDMRNRTVSAVRHDFSKMNGRMGTDGSVAYLFAQQGVLSYGSGISEHVVTEAAIEAGAVDVVVHDEGHLDVLTDATCFVDIKEAILAAGFDSADSGVTMRPATEVSVLKLLDMLEDLDDAQDVYSNADIPAESYEQL